MGQTSTRFLLDSGAAVSVVHYDSLDECWRHRIKDDVAQNTVAADGLPLEVVGHIGIPISLGKFGADNEFTVVKNLSVECILGADFLVRYDAVIDCRENTLALGDNLRCEVPISIAPSIQPSTLEGITVAIPNTMEIPARSVMLITAQLSRVDGREGFVEPLSTTRTGIPKGILVARTLTQVCTSQNIMLEVTNISPTPTKVYKGTTLGTFTPMDERHVSWDIMGPLPTSESGNKYIRDLSVWCPEEPISVVQLSRLSATYWEWGPLIGNGENKDISLPSPRGMDRSSDSIEHAVEAILAKTVKDNQRDWDLCLQKALFAYRTSLHETTGFTPFHLVFGRTSKLPIDVMLGRMEEADFQDYPPFVQGLHSKLKCAFEQTRGKLSTSHKHQKRFYDRGSWGS